MEKMFVGKDAKQKYQEASEGLAKAVQEFHLASAEVAAIQDRNLMDLRERNNQEFESTNESLRQLLITKAASGDGYDGSLEAQITQLSQLAADNNIYQALITEVLDKREAERTSMNLYDLSNISKKVDEAMLQARIEAHPRLAKVNDWIKKHPKTRMALGLGLSGLGLIGAATFNAPLVGLSMAGSAALRGYGSYNFARGIGEALASGKMNKAQISTIEDYLSVSDKQSDTRRKSKIVGSVVAAALIVAPLVGRVLDQVNHASPASSLSHHHKPFIKPQASTNTVTPNPSITPVGANTLPWNYAEQVLHTNISNPAILDKLVHNPLGITFNGNGLGGGLGAINSISYGGHIYTDLGHINGAIQAILEATS